MEPFSRLKNRANLFRRKNFSSQINISSNPSSSDHIVPSDHSSTFNPHPSGHVVGHGDVIQLKRSNSMICPQQRFQTLLNSNRSHSHHRNSICFELAGCSTDESSTDDYQLSKSSFNRYSSAAICSRMSHIDEHEIVPQNEPSIEEDTGIKIETTNDVMFMSIIFYCNLFAA